MSTRPRGRRSRRWGITAAIAALLCLVATDLAAQSSGDASTGQNAAGPSSGEASGSSETGSFEETVQQGKVHFTKGNYEKARAAFKKAYEMKESPNLLFNIGLAAEKSGDLEAALEHYEKFVVSPNVTLKLREKAQKRIDVLEPIVEDQKSKAGEKKAERPDELKEQSDELANAQKKEGGGESTEKQASDETDEGGASSDDEPAGSDAIDEAGGGSPVAGYLLTGVGVAAIGGGVAFTLMSEQAKQRFASAPKASQRRAAREAAWRNQWIADGMFVVGLGTAVGGVALLLSRGKVEASEGSTALIPALGPDFAGVEFRADF